MEAFAGSFCEATSGSFWIELLGVYLARAEELQLLSAEQYWSKDSGHDTGRESIGTFGAVFVFVRFNITVRSDFRSIENVISIILLNLHEFSARAHRSWEELEAEKMGFKHGQK